MELELTEDQAREKLAQVVGGLDRIPPCGQRGDGFWCFTFDALQGQIAPPGSPSWLVLDDGRCASIGTRERLGGVLDRLQSA